MILSAAPDMMVRRAVAADAPALSRIARAAKAFWGYSPEALEAWSDSLEISAGSIGEWPTFVLLAGAAGDLAGFYQLRAERALWALEHLWIHPAWMRQGLGSTLMRHAVAQTAAAGVAMLTIDAEPNAEAFYLAWGARRVGVVPAPIAGDADRVRPQLVLDVEALPPNVGGG